MDDNAFKTALDAGTAIRTEAGKASMAASLDQAYADVQTLKAKAAADPTHAYYNAPATFWANMEAPVMAARIRAGLAPVPTPKTAQQMAEEQVAEERSRIPHEVNPNMQTMLDAQLAALDAKGGQHVAQETDKLAEHLGRETHAKMVADAKRYLGAKYNPAVAAFLPALRVAAQLANMPR